MSYVQLDVHYVLTQFLIIIIYCNSNSHIFMYLVGFEPTFRCSMRGDSHSPKPSEPGTTPVTVVNSGDVINPDLPTAFGTFGRESDGRVQPAAADGKYL
jgi:hypothetical protein